MGSGYTWFQRWKEHAFNSSVGRLFQRVNSIGLVLDRWKWAITICSDWKCMAISVRQQSPSGQTTLPTRKSFHLIEVLPYDVLGVVEFDSFKRGSFCFPFSFNHLPFFIH